MIGIDLMSKRILQDCDPQLLDKVQIIHNSTDNVDLTKKTILVLHCLPHDPQVEYLKEGGWSQFDQIVFVSHWLQEQYYMYHKIPYNAGTVLYNAIEPIKQYDKTDPKKNLRIVYFTDPRRGLDYLYPVINELSQQYPQIKLHVYPNITKFDKLDEGYDELLELIGSHDNMVLHKNTSNDKIREVLKKSHIFAYPSVWQETFCLPLVEALSAGCYCVHSSLGALKETSLGLTQMYSFSDNRQNHVDKLYVEMKKAVMLHHYNYDYVKQNTDTTKTIADFKYDWSRRKLEWNQLMEHVIQGG